MTPKPHWLKTPEVHIMLVIYIKLYQLYIISADGVILLSESLIFVNDLLILYIFEEWLPAKL